MTEQNQVELLSNKLHEATNDAQKYAYEIFKLNEKLDKECAYINQLHMHISAAAKRCGTNVETFDDACKFLSSIGADDKEEGDTADGTDY